MNVYRNGRYHLNLKFMALYYAHLFLLASERTRESETCAEIERESERERVRERESERERDSERERERERKRERERGVLYYLTLFTVYTVDSH